jgi:hypothetical protein
MMVEQHALFLSISFGLLLACCRMTGVLRVRSAVIIASTHGLMVDRFPFVLDICNSTGQLDSSGSSLLREKYQKMCYVKTIEIKVVPVAFDWSVSFD